ncbi:MAG: radical SAM protein [Geobacter sp.]|nr:radical SAM protein [Geobacter sp.]
MKRLIVPFFITHQGCPHRCIFCDQARIAGGAEALPSATEIVARIAAYRASAGTESAEVAFYGGSFTALPREDQQRLLEPLQPLMRSGEVSSIRVSTRPDAIDDSIAAFLLERGVRTVELGIQSMDDAVLERAERGHGAEDVRKAFCCLQAAGIAVGAQLMPGLPGDSPETSIQSLLEVLSLRPAFLRIYPAVVLKGTRLEELYRSGDYAPLDLEHAVTICKAMLRETMAAGVPVIRIGLQPTDDLNMDGAVIAGPYHPAFRQLVESALWYDFLNMETKDISPGSDISIRCAPSRISDVTGHKRDNVRRLHNERGVRVGSVMGDAALSPHELAVEANGEVRVADINSFVNVNKQEVNIS